MNSPIVIEMLSDAEAYVAAHHSDLDEETADRLAWTIIQTDDIPEGDCTAWLAENIADLRDYAVNYGF